MAATQTMFGKPFETITEAVHALPYPNFSNVVVAYPSLGDWVRLYNTRSRGFSWNRAMYHDFKRRHEKTVTKQLDAIAGRVTGRTVLAEFSSTPDYSVMILPYDFLPRNSTSWRPGVLAVTRATDRDMEHDPAPCRKTPNGGLACFAPEANNSGSSVDIYFTASRQDDASSDMPDDTLLHELVHATRKIAGVLDRVKMNGGYKNLEEFLAVVVENIYRSERLKSLKAVTDYQGGAIDAANFLDNPKLIPRPRFLLEHMRSRQPALFAALAAIPSTVAPFNPIRQLAEQAKAGQGH